MQNQTTNRPRLRELVEPLQAMILDAEQEIEENRRIPDEITEALYDCGMYRAFMPAEVGGLEVHPVEWLEAVEYLSSLNGSVGWLCMLHSGTTSLQPDVMRRILKDEKWIIAGNAGRAAGVARAVEGGYWISGRWPFASGSPEARYLFGSCILHDDDGNEILSPKDGLPWIVTPYIPAKDVTLHDTWDGLGLRGTGSGDFSVENVFVPAEMVDERGIWRLTYGIPHEKGPFVLSAHSAHAIGLAKAAFDEFTRLTQLKVRRGSYRQKRFASDENMQALVAQADARIRSARLLMNDVNSQAFESAKNNRHIDYELRVLLAEVNIHIVHECREIVDNLFQQSGTGGVFKSSLLGRIYRDMMTAANHIIIAKNQLTSIGEYWLTKDLEGGPTISNVEMSAIFPPHPQFADRAKIIVHVPTRKKE